MVPRSDQGAARPVTRTAVAARLAGDVQALLVAGDEPAAGLLAGAFAALLAAPGGGPAPVIDFAAERVRRAR
jgi:hypothetical protein